MLDKYWRSDAGKKESKLMKEKRARVGATSTLSFSSSKDSPTHKRHRHGNDGPDLSQYSKDNYTDTDFNQMSSPVRLILSIHPILN